jgi:NADH-quinone oxidoreductase subunit N
MGYLLMGLAALVPIVGDGTATEKFSNLVSNGLLFHMVSYGFTSMAAFLCVIVVYNKTGRDDISGLAGLSKRQPMVSLVLVSALFSMAGLPIFVGFASKFYLFNAVGGQGLLWLVGLAIVMSLISLYYYLMVARQLYIESSEDGSPISVSFPTKVVLVGLFGVMIVLGVYPAPLMAAIQRATDAIVSGNLLSLV